MLPEPKYIIPIKLIDKPTISPRTSEYNTLVRSLAILSHKPIRKIIDLHRSGVKTRRLLQKHLSSYPNYYQFIMNAQYFETIVAHPADYIMKKFKLAHEWDMPLRGCIITHCFVPPPAGLPISVYAGKKFEKPHSFENAIKYPSIQIRGNVTIKQLKEYIDATAPTLDYIMSTQSAKETNYKIAPKSLLLGYMSKVMNVELSMSPNKIAQVFNEACEANQTPKLIRVFGLEDTHGALQRSDRFTLNELELNSQDITNALNTFSTNIFSRLMPDIE